MMFSLSFLDAKDLRSALAISLLLCTACASAPVQWHEAGSSPAPRQSLIVRNQSMDEAFIYQCQLDNCSTLGVVEPNSTTMLKIDPNRLDEDDVHLAFRLTLLGERMMTDPIHLDHGSHLVLNISDVAMQTTLVREADGFLDGGVTQNASKP